MKATKSQTGDEPKAEPANKSVDLANEIFSLKELINTIMDFYAFKNNITEGEEEEEADKWKELTNGKPASLIPDEVNHLIEKSFEAQLKRFT